MSTFLSLGIMQQTDKEIFSKTVNTVIPILAKLALNDLNLILFHSPCIICQFLSQSLKFNHCQNETPTFLFLESRNHRVSTQILALACNVTIFSDNHTSIYIE